MSNLPRFAAYAAAFEKSYASDDWSHVKPFFAADAVYEIVGMGPPLGGRFEGLDAILAYFRRILDGFDRRFATRTIGLIEGPQERGDTVWLRGWAAYRAPGLPELRFELEETATFAGGHIVRLEDRYAPAETERIDAYVREHGAKLGIAA
jgi:hypothetical protein